MQLLIKSIFTCALFVIFVYATAQSLIKVQESETRRAYLNITSSSDLSSSNLSLDDGPFLSRRLRQVVHGEEGDEGAPSQLEDDLRQMKKTNVDAPDVEEIRECSVGLVLPVWMPQKHLSIGDRLIRGFVYFILLIYLFVGVSIIADRFMAAIEAITSIERAVVVKGPNNTKQVMHVRIWNETVANLTLMALGSSAPEILLSVIEIYAKDFESGDLGPGTIVGSAAYNLFMIIAVCMIWIPAGEVRRIRHLRVFFVTAAFSIFAYVWLWLILSVFTPGVIQVWEAIVTLLFFPLTVLWAYIAERRLLVYKYMDKNYRVNKRGTVVAGEHDQVEMDAEKGPKHPMVTSGRANEAEAFDEARREYVTVLTKLRQKYPDADLEQLEMMAQEQVLARSSKSRAFYRIQATRKMVGSGNLMRKIQERAHSDLTEVKAQLHSGDYDETDDLIRMYFEPGHYTVMENCGEFEVRVVRRGDLSVYASVEYETQDGTASAGTDFVGRKGLLSFPPGVDEQRFRIEVIDDDVFEEDECFYIRLFNPSEGVKLAVPMIATVMILDDDHAGIFAFTDSAFEITESVGKFELKVMRYSGARGTVIVPYWTENDTATESKDYEEARGELVFENNESEKVIDLYILEESSYEKDVSFKVHIGEPRLAPDDTNKESFFNRFFEKHEHSGDPTHDEMAAKIKEVEKKDVQDLTELDRILLLSKPRNGELTTAYVRIRESQEFKATVDKLVAKANVSAVLGTSSWKEQFKDALTVIPADESEFDNDDEEEEVPSCFSYVSHFVCLFWKVLFAFVPPTDMCGGYVTFVVSIFVIGVITAIIGDAASYFGCALNIKDSVTAILFVALGTSIPDTFASMIAAKHDEGADNCIGNVTGSNAVNVFLGIGLAWTIAAVYHSSHGGIFKVEPGTIGFAVALFCGEALIAVFLIMFRRWHKGIGAELGGPKVSKYISAAILVFLWVFYVVICILEAYDVIRV
ncbi:sodium/calcium exchanger 3 isoform X1 [Drosophila eugracilis]|uniref:sodium/calcium exchanger 3 isoform X1 n=1 Tax=Drosophila eugracilis TaxID=29029 RepID=UPI001BDADB23|nr:sodium/calcium exchanger 3 isoform X1 [Drosophila eugracilis]XP_017074656.2 sodium/calcium exchanger 3 isoform X1 [Drosophila eugracilis]XP_017074657.2 sodium/calcium exchanger 3 isoform X1 [Drosophila eugracilis]XP_017074659.2 sodium/calcium exchanger 3 isoform X1 [Drosophila eugracilis]XP_017074660.2 sodium/calcium exchanger 3 isoform X1 [Drosophila eugracilis]XP_041673878.1 sodium/calcium exchanger 3 isoform X1 [Drosophila eugracilis]